MVTSYSISPWPVICPVQFSLYLSSHFVLLRVQSCRSSLMGSPSPGKKSSQAGSSWGKFCPIIFLVSHLTVVVQLASAISHSPSDAIRGNSARLWPWKFFPDKNEARISILQVPKILSSFLNVSAKASLTAAWHGGEGRSFLSVGIYTKYQKCFHRKSSNLKFFISS